MAEETKKKPTKKATSKSKRWSSKEEQELALMYGSGVDKAQIAKALMRPENSIQSKIYRMKLKPPKKEEVVLEEIEIRADQEAEVARQEPLKKKSFWDWLLGA